MLKQNTWLQEHKSPPASQVHIRFFLLVPNGVMEAQHDRYAGPMRLSEHKEALCHVLRNAQAGLCARALQLKKNETKKTQQRLSSLRWTDW